MPSAPRRKDSAILDLPSLYRRVEKLARKADRFEKEIERDRRKAARQKKSEWEEQLPSSSQHSGAFASDNVKVMFFSHAKKQFALSNRELQSLHIFHCDNIPSGRCLIALHDLLAHARKRQEDIDVSCPALDVENESLIPHVVVKPAEYLAGLLELHAAFEGHQ